MRRLWPYFYIILAESIETCCFSDEESFRSRLLGLTTVNVSVSLENWIAFESQSQRLRLFVGY